MHSYVRNVHTSAFHTIREVAWILGVDPSEVCRAIRTGALLVVRRRSRLMVPAYALTRLLNEPVGANAPTATSRHGGGGVR